MIARILAALALLAALIAAPTAAHATTLDEPVGVPGLECPAGYVPGWLDANGDPTSCVRDCPDWREDGTCIDEPALPEPLPLEPTPAPEQPVEPEPVPAPAPLPAPVVDALPETGPKETAQTTALALALALLGGGTTLVLLGRRDSTA